eukprot:CAMPEP_0197575392 /NCGR_PEP_ID=MMETSP1326-20131121/812_1 /TAXON_ID=1155430 /ORGANISM="Genus nov. species nov., Strain RCC2288" /LENGTH=65 /DNA_ID=CAMNT_0043138151 /DNA_START=159 /DNA_END=352 /DNA_ORIENTATION=+
MLCCVGLGVALQGGPLRVFCFLKPIHEFLAAAEVAAAAGWASAGASAAASSRAASPCNRASLAWP